MSLFLPYLYSAQTVRDTTFSSQIDYIVIINFLNPKRHQNPISDNKSYSHFSEGVDFAYWLICIGKGLRLQPAASQSAGSIDSVSEPILARLTVV